MQSNGIEFVHSAHRTANRLLGLVGAHAWRYVH